MRNRDIEQQIHDAGTRAGEQARKYANGAADRAQSLYERSRRIGARLGRGNGYGQQLANAAEDFADEANYRYRRLRRQVNRHPAATVAIIAGTIGAFLLLRQAFRSDDED
ncbi:MAG: hypothetical protein EPN49_13315 [Rhodanobacter sp.]|nr:MAG: hypothetical protein EPN49_13315 [Rhodanobacter sp.]